MFDVGDTVKVVKYIDGLNLIGKEGKIITQQLITVIGSILYLVVIDGEKYGLYDDEMVRVENA